MSPDVAVTRPLIIRPSHGPSLLWASRRGGDPASLPRARFAIHLRNPASAGSSRQRRSKLSVRGERWIWTLPLINLEIAAGQASELIEPMFECQATHGKLQGAESSSRCRPVRYLGGCFKTHSLTWLLSPTIQPLYFKESWQYSRRWITATDYTM